MDRDEVPLVLVVKVPGFLVGIRSLGLEVVDSSSAVVCAAGSVVMTVWLVETEVLMNGVVSDGDPVSSTIEPPSPSASSSSSLSPISAETWTGQRRNESFLLRNSLLVFVAAQATSHETFRQLECKSNIFN